MSVKIIDTLKPKNDGSFPIVEAVDIAVTDELRLPEALDAKADASALAETNAAVEAKANASDVSTATANLQGQINQIEISASAEAVVAPEVAAARVDSEGTEYSTLKERLDASDSAIETKASQSEIDSVNESLLHVSESLQGGDIYQVIDESKFVNGQWQIGNEINSPTYSAYVGDVKQMFLFSNISRIELLDSTCDISFAGVSDEGEIESVPITWITDKTTLNATDILENSRASNQQYFAIQLRKKSGAIDCDNTFITSYINVFCKESPVGTEKIEDKAVTDKKLSDGVMDRFDKLSQLKTKVIVLLEGNVERGVYENGDSIEDPLRNSSSSAYYTLRKIIPIDENSFSLTLGYKVAFSSATEEGIINGTPVAWVTDSVITPEKIRSNTGVADATYFVVRVAKDGDVPLDASTKIEDVLQYTQYYQDIKLRSANVPAGLISETMLDAEVRSKLNNQTYGVDVIMFMGQSNMAGRGEVASAPTIDDGAGYEYRAISDPNNLHVMAEPFGATENNPNGINEGSSKTGSMVTAFSNAYFKYNGGIPVIGISASKGGTTISDWQPNGAYLTDAIARLRSCVSYLTSNGYTIRHKYILWCQGESDGDESTTAATYKTLFDTMLAAMKAEGIEKLFMVRIGNYNVGTSDKYKEIMECQTEIAQTETDVVMASTDFAGMRARGLMKDQFHYYQAGYNEIGTFSGINVAEYVNTGKEPTMYDTEDGTLYYSHKN